MVLQLTESQAINDMAKLLYDFLPGKPHPLANQQISFVGVAHDLGLSNFWVNGSKLPSTTILLEKTLELQRERFCKLILEIVRRGMIYRNSKSKPITQEEITKLNKLIEKVKFKIPELWDPQFLHSLPTIEPAEPQPTQVKKVTLEELKHNLAAIEKTEPQARGFAFERFLKELFDAFDLRPRSS
ncbi:MAG: hypothetical protein JNN15_17160, partial [Blastocatellia bacterium]|nr:hypothetical protein [Blastocatellia bacterium]